MFDYVMEQHCIPCFDYGSVVRKTFISICVAGVLLYMWNTDTSIVDYTYYVIVQIYLIWNEWNTGKANKA